MKTISKIAAEFEIHPAMIRNGKKEMLEHLPELFENKNARKAKNLDQETEQLHRKVGQLNMEWIFSKKPANSWEHP